MELGMDGVVHVKSWVAFWELPQIPLVSDEGIPLRVLMAWLEEAGLDMGAFWFV